MQKNLGKFILIGVIVVLAAAFFYFDLGQYLTLESIKSQRASFQEYYDANVGLTIIMFMVAYVAVTALSLPGAALMTLSGGALFGLGLGLVLVSISSTLGATLAFLTSRYLIGNSVQEKFGDKLKKINEGIEKDGAFYLFTLRLIPAFPFFVVNLAMGLTPIKVSTYFLVSMVGMLPGTAVYVNAGTQIGQLESASGILSFNLIASFALLGIFPLIAKKALNAYKKKRES